MDTTTPPPAEQPAPPQPFGPAPQRSGSDGFFDAMRRIGVVRSQDRWIGGVSGGIALRFGIDPLLVRGIFGVTALLGGAGLVIYGLAWALLPEQSDGRIHVQETLRGRFDVALLGAVGMFLVGISRGDGWFGWWDGNGYGFVWFAASVALVALLIAALGQRRRDRHARMPQTPGGAPTGSSGGPSVYEYPTAQHQSPPPPYGAAPYTPAPSYSAPYAPQPQVQAQQPNVQQPYVQQPYVQPPYAPQPPVPPRDRVRGPGSAAVGTVVGLSFVALAALLFIERLEGDLNLSVGLTAVGIAIVLAGIGIIVAGLRGRKSGTLGFLAIVGVVVATPVAVGTVDGWFDPGPNSTLIASDSTWTPTTRDQARDGLAVAVGDMDVDLTDLNPNGTPIRVPISLGAGDMTVIVPDGTAVSASIQLAAGDISWEVDGDQAISGVSGSRSYDFASSEVTDSTSAELVLDIEAGAGQIRVVEESR